MGSKKDRRLELYVGALICSGLVILGAMIIGFQQFKTHRGVYVLNATFTFAGGIQKGTPIRVAGYHVGRVRSVEWDSKSQLVRAVLEVDLGYQIKRDAKLVVDTSGMLGEPYLEFTAGTPDAAILKPRDTVRGQVPPSLTELRVEGLAMVRSINQAAAEVEKLVTSIRTDVIKEVNERSKQAESVLSETEHLVKELRTTNRNLNQNLDGVSEIVSKVQTGDGTFHSLIYKKELYDNANALMVNATDAAKQMQVLADYLKKNPSDLVWGRRDSKNGSSRPGRDSDGRPRVNLTDLVPEENKKAKTETGRER